MLTPSTMSRVSQSRTTALSGICCVAGAVLRPVTRRDELLELRKELGRLGILMQQAIASLRAAGQTRDADRLERELAFRLKIFAPSATTPGVCRVQVDNGLSSSRAYAGRDRPN